MTIHRFRTKAVALGVLLTAISFLQAQPNVLFISVDDLRPELGCYGAERIRTPQIDRLAGEGTMFRRAYCNYPVCGASRASLMTGLRPTPRRFTNYDTRADVDAKGVMDLAGAFKKAGYRTVANGKIYHNRTDNAASWDEIHRPKEYGQYFTKSSLKATGGKGGKKGPPYEASDRSDDDYQGGKVAAKAINELRRAKKSGKPVFITAGFTKPHLPFNCPQKYWDLYPLESIRLPDNYHVPKDAPKTAIHQWGELRSYHGVPEKGPLNDEMALEMIRGYRACVSFTDAMVGRLLAELDTLDMWDDTIVILWGDHGWQLGEHTMWCKHCNFETSLRVPLIVKAPGHPGGAACERLVEFVDVYPTLCELAGLPLPEHLEGRSFAPLLEDPKQEWKESVFARYGKGDSIVTDRYIYTEWLGKPGKPYARMLYDHQTDPDENVNISEHPENRELVEKLSAQLRSGWPHLRGLPR